MAKYRSQSIDHLVAVARALGDDGRVRIVALLEDGELCLCQLIDILGLAPSTVSKHVSILRQAGLIEQRKEGRWHFYRLADGRGDRGRADARGPSPLVRQAIRWVTGNLGEEPTVAADAKRLCGVQQMNPEELTKCYRTPAAS